MDYARFELIRLEHGHGKHDWHRMDEAAADDAARHDPEREWGRHRIFKCSTCDEQIRIAVPDTEPPVG